MAGSQEVDKHPDLDDIDADPGSLGILSNRAKRRLKERSRVDAAAWGEACDGGEAEGDNDGADSPFDDALTFDLAAKPDAGIVRVAAPPFVTASPLPGTTLRTVRVDFFMCVCEI